MSQIFPDVSRMSVVFASSAEQHVYELSAKLPGAWRVYYSCTLAFKEQDSGTREGEIDFVFYHPQFGVIVMEVKGGRISLDGETGQFYSVNRHGRSFAIRNPFQQAITFRNRFVRFLRSHDIQCPVSHAVCFPQVDESEFPAHVNIDHATILGRSRLGNLEKTLQDIVHSFHKDDFLRFADVAEKLDDLLVGATFQSKPMLREYINTHEATVLEIDAVHDALIHPVMGVPRMGIEGEAGTGKTVLAVGLARYFRDRGEAVTLLVGSPLLAAHLVTEVGQGVKITTFQELASTFGVNLIVAPSEFEGTADQWIQYEAPERLRRAIEASSSRSDVLIVDEAQDVQPFWWVALEELLTSRENGRLYVFFDRSQGVFGGGEGAHSFTPEETLPVPSNFIQLARNYRNTAQISNFAREFRRGGVSISRSERMGYQPVVIGYKTSDEAYQKLNELVTRLIEDHGLHEHEIVILSARAPEARESVLLGRERIGGLRIARITGERVRAGRLAVEGEIGVATIASFKGLEAKVVIVVNMAEYKMPLENPIMGSLAYVACTRAKHMLYVLSKEDDPKHAVLLKAQAGSPAAGAMVLDSGDRPGEYIGRVVHYNPGRLGIIEMTTGDDMGRTVIVLPADVEKSGIRQFKSSQSVRFRLRSEGGVPTAVALAVDD